MRRGFLLLIFLAASSLPVAAAPLQTAVFAGGCFWGIEGVFEHVKGVRSATSGYAGGRTPNPTYRQVSTGSTGHAEAVQVVFDPAQVSYEDLLRVFFLVAHDPTQRNRQGPDVGTQYRSALFFTNETQRQQATAFLAELRQRRAFAQPIVTEMAPLRTFFRAEDYHQDYMAQHPDQAYIVAHDAPKVERLRRELPALYRARE